MKSVAREPGMRSKIAVVSRDETIDAVGACVGPKGQRVQNIVDELNDEKIDIVKWDEDPAVYIANSLSPAKCNFRRCKRRRKNISRYCTGLPIVFGYR